MLMAPVDAEMPDAAAGTLSAHPSRELHLPPNETFARLRAEADAASQTVRAADLMWMLTLAAVFLAIHVGRMPISDTLLGISSPFVATAGDVLMILDADLTMPPEALPKYHAVIETGKADFVNGTRLVYPMEDEAMRPLNLMANRFFAYLFSYLVNTRMTDTLCGTKVLLRKDYEVLVREREYFGNFDPFGDFDLIFGAAKQNLKIIETPIHYKARTFGETQISRFRDGWLLLKMVWFAYRKLKAI